MRLFEELKQRMQRAAQLDSFGPFAEPRLADTEKGLARQYLPCG